MFVKMSLWFQTLLVVLTVVYSTADEDYENKLTKLWSLSGSSNSDGSAVLNVTSASIVIQPSYDETRNSRNSGQQFKKYAFKPRAIPLRRAEQPSQVERSVYYTPDEKYKSEILFPGNYLPIAKEKSNENLTKDSVYSPRSGGAFHPKAIPLFRTEEFQKRSLDQDAEPIIKKPEGFSEQPASRRSISYLLGDLDEADEEEEAEDDIDLEDGTEGKRRKKPKIKPDVLGEFEDAVDGEDDYDEDESGDAEDTEDTEEETEDTVTKIEKKHRKKPKIKVHKLMKYARPLLLAYKMKFFAIAPILLAGLLMIIKMKAIAGFFFALFAAVMGLNKGSF